MPGSVAVSARLSARDCRVDLAHSADWRNGVQNRETLARSSRERGGIAASLLVTSALCGCFGAGSAHAQQPEGCSKVSAPEPFHLSQPPNLDFFKQQLLHYRCTRY